MGPVLVPMATPQEVGMGRGERGSAQTLSTRPQGQLLGPALSLTVRPGTAVACLRLRSLAPATGRVVEGSRHLPGSNLLHFMALWPVPAPPLQHSPRPPLPSPYIWPVPGLSLPPPCRYLTAALASSARCVSRAPGDWVACARATGSARTGSWAAESATATKASMEQPVRCASWAAMGPPVPEVTGDGGGR